MDKLGRMEPQVDRQSNYARRRLRPAVARGWHPNSCTLPALNVQAFDLILDMSPCARDRSTFGRGYPLSLTTLGKGNCRTGRTEAAPYALSGRAREGHPTGPVYRKQQRFRNSTGVTGPIGDGWLDRLYRGKDIGHC